MTDDSGRDRRGDGGAGDDRGGGRDGGHGDHHDGGGEHGDGGLDQDDDGHDDLDEGHGHHDEEHDHHHHDVESLGAAVVTVSSSRTLDDDPSGDAIVAALEDAGHEVVVRELVRDDFDGVQGRVATLVEREDVDALVTTGGTGVTPDDVTVEAVEPLFEKHLPGFGELFRRLSYDEIGSRVVGTRAVAGVADRVPVFCLPGSEHAAALGAGELVVPEAPHLAGLARRDD